MKLGLWEILLGGGVFGGGLFSIVIIGLICGAISKAISRSRGMSGGFWWGFFLWIIGIIVVAVRPNDKRDALDAVTRNEIVEDTQPIVSDTESIKQYKELLDSGAITQEEYDAKKKQILGL